MFTQFPHELWNVVSSATEIAVLLRILKNIGFAEDGVCYESRESMCNACYVSKDTWRKAIESLEDKKIIVVEKVSNKPYRITLHENYAEAKIRTRNRYNNIYRDPILALALENSTIEPSTEIQKIHTKWIKGRYKVKWKKKKEGEDSGS